MVDVQHRLETVEGVDLHRAQGQMRQLRILNTLPQEIEYYIFQYEEAAKREEALNGR